MKCVCLLLVVLVASQSADAWWFSDPEPTIRQAAAGFDQSCLDAVATEGSCAFFDCFEQRFPCGEDFYVEKFGKKYCQRFAQATNNFNAIGQEFLVNSQRCIMGRIAEHYGNASVNCDRLDDLAIASTYPCYHDNGFCNVIDDNTAAFLDIFDFSDAFALRNQLTSLAGTCGDRALSNFGRAMADALFRWRR